MTASYCRMAATEAMLDCCELEGLEGVVCDAAVPPTTCVVECAELWEPLVEDCEEHLQDFQQLTVECVSLCFAFGASSLSEHACAHLPSHDRLRVSGCCTAGAQRWRTRSWRGRRRP